MKRNIFLSLIILSCVFFASSNAEAQRITVSGSAIESWSVPLSINKLSTMNVDIGNGNIFINKTSNNVGIGTNNPLYKLQVNGIINATGLYVNGAPYVNSQWISSSTSIYYTAGNVGIGTTNPGYIFDVIGGTRFTQPVLVGTPTAPDHVATKNYVDSAFSTGISGSIGYIPKFIGTNSIVNSVIFESGGYIGIGTTSPGAKLDVNGNAVIRGTSIFNKSTASTVIAGYVGAGGNINAPVSFYDALEILGNNNIVLNASPTNAWRTDMLIASSTGNIGINSTAPAYKLDVVGTSQFSQPILTSVPTATSHAATKGYVDSVAGAGLLGGGTASYLAKWTASSTVATSTIYDNGTNIGIGTNSVTAKLDIKQSVDDNTGAIRIRNIADGRQFNIYVDGSNNSIINSGSTGTGPLLLNTGGGSVGIGTTIPLTLLDIRTGSNVAIPSLSTVPGAGISLLVGNTGTNGVLSMGNDNGGNAWIQGRSRLGDGSSESLLLNPLGGNVGIATSSPAYTLQVYGTSAFSQPVNVGTPTANAHATTKAYVDSAMLGALNGSAGYIPKFTGTNSVGSSVMYESSGNIGIGTTNPSDKLTVVNGEVSIIRLDGGESILNLGDSLSGADRYVGRIAYNHTDNRMSFSINSNYAAPELNIKGGNVGIATTTPAYALQVYGTAAFSQPVNVGTPTANAHATTKSYLDSALTGKLSLAGGTMIGNINMNGNNLSGVGKLTVTTIDPLYEINGAKYSTYSSSIAGGVKEEYVGRAELIKNSERKYQYTIDFNKVIQGSDLWVWKKAVDFSKNNVEVLATAYEVPVPIAYEISGEKIIFNSELSPTLRGLSSDTIEFSYRLVGKRVDWKEWPTLSKDQNELPSIIIE